MVAPKQIALNKLGEVRNEDPTKYQVIQELQQQTNEYILDQHKAASALVGVVRGGAPFTAAELSGDGTTSGSNVLTVTGLNKTSLAGLATGIVKNTTGTGVPSIAVAGDFPTLNQSTTGSAATLTTPRAINGTNFDGSAPITVTADANTLTGTTLHSTVLASSLTSVGTLANLTVTNPVTAQGMLESRTLFVQTSNSTTTANTNSTVLGTGSGTKTLPANTLTVGRAVRVKAGGYVSVATTTGAPTLTVLVGGSAVAQQTGAAAFTNILNSGWEIDVTIVCRSVGGGGAGSVIGTGSFRTAVTGTSDPQGVIVGAAIATVVDTTTTLAVDVQLNNGVATGTYTTAWATIEILN